MVFTVSLLATLPAQLMDWGPEAIRGADFVEVRLDHALEQDWPAWRTAVEALQMPFIVSLHGAGGLGTVAGDRGRHLRLLREAAGWGARFVDVDWSLASDLNDLPADCGRIVSMHRTQAWDGNWKDAYGELERRALPSDRIKFVVAADNAMQGLQVMTWARSLPKRAAGRLLFCMGEGVAFTRILARALGDAWMYVAPKGKPFLVAAPGQYTLPRLLDRSLPEPGLQNPRFLAVLGHPIEHSLSPEIQGAALRAAGEGVYYMAIDPGDSAHWEPFLAAAVDFGFEGFAVTAPFKTQAFAGASERTPEALEVGAANTLAWRGDHFAAHNTDGVGVAAALERAWPAHALERGLPPELRGQRALIVGAGGAARAARVACTQLGLRVDVCTRREAAGDAWVQEFGGNAWRPWQVHAGSFDVILQTTPLGWGGRGMSIGPSALDRNTLVVDAVYQPALTPLLGAARALGASVVEGRDWFLAQALAQFEWLVGRPADREVMAIALDRRLAQDFDPLSVFRDKPLVLIGMRATGKSTLGRAWAAALGWTFVDADEALVETYRGQHPESPWSSAGELLVGLGESEFRRLEAEECERLLALGPGRVIASGGGLVETEAARDRLASRALCLWLDLPPEDLQARLREDFAGRPALTAAGLVEEVPAIYARRWPWYSALAHFGWRADRAKGSPIPALWLEGLRRASQG